MDDYGNATRWSGFRDACYAHGIIAGVWFTDAWNLTSCPSDALFVIGELESEGDYQGCVNAIGRLPDIPRAVVTNFTPLATPRGAPIVDKGQVLVEAGFTCLTECYIGDAPSTTPPNQAHFASHFGWQNPQPVFGIYNKPLSAYSEWMQGGWSTYLGEYDQRLV